MNRPAPYGSGPGLDWDCSAEWWWVRANAGSAGLRPALLILGGSSTLAGPPFFVSHREIYFVETRLDFEVHFILIDVETHLKLMYICAFLPNYLAHRTFFAKYTSLFDIRFRH